MRILAIDPAVRKTGLCLPDRSTRTLESPAEMKGPKRLIYLRWKIQEIIKHEQPNLVVIEDYALGGSHPSSAIPTCEWGGVLRVAVDESGVAWRVAPPQAIKYYVTGKGNAKKELVCSSLSAKTGITFPNSDEADAFALAALAAHYYGSVPWFKVTETDSSKSFKQLKWESRTWPLVKAGA